MRRAYRWWFMAAKWICGTTSTTWTLRGTCWVVVERPFRRQRRLSSRRVLLWLEDMPARQRELPAGSQPGSPLHTSARHDPTPCQIDSLHVHVLINEDDVRTLARRKAPDLARRPHNLRRRQRRHPHRLP